MHLVATGAARTALHAHETTEASAGQGAGRARGASTSRRVRTTRRWCHVEGGLAVEQVPLRGRRHEGTGHGHRVLLHLQGADDDGLAVIVAVGSRVSKRGIGFDRGLIVGAVSGVRH